MCSIPVWTHATSLGYIAGGRDLNGDGYADLVCMSVVPSAYVFLGSAHPDTLPAYQWEMLGIFAMLGDLNHDGYDDLCSAQSGWASISWGGRLFIIRAMCT
jgi:hypothetical protein